MSRKQEESAVYQEHGYMDLLLPLWDAKWKSPSLSLNIDVQREL